MEEEHQIDMNSGVERWVRDPYGSCRLVNLELGDIIRTWRLTYHYDWY